eukprot:gene10787-3404_t
MVNRLILLFVTLISIVLYLITYSEKQPFSFEEFKKLKVLQSYTTFDKSFPKEFLQPKTVEEIISIIKKSNKDKKIVKVIGSGHSLNAIGMTNDTLLNLDFLNKVIEVNKKNKQITVEGGIRLKDLNIVLEKHGLSLSNLGTITEQSIAGAIITGTHGTSSLKNGKIFHGPISSFITSFEMIDGEGNIHFASKDNNLELYNAGRISLGALGIITKVTIQCESFFRIETEKLIQSVPETISNFRNYLKDNDFVTLWYFPYADKFIVKLQKKTKKEITIKSDFQKYIQGYEGFLFVKIRRIFEYISYSIMQHLFMVIFSPKSRDVEKSYLALSPFGGNGADKPYNAMEYIIPLENFEKFHEEFRYFMNNSPVKSNFFNEIRFIGKDSSMWLSKFQFDAASFHIELHNQSSEKWKQYHLEAERILKKYGGIAHWAKTFSKTKEELKKDYPKFEDFKKLRKQMDPNGIFYNEFLKNLFE